jgi:hypothetical protein
LVYFLSAGAVLDAQNKVPAGAVGLGHRVAVYTAAFLSTFGATYRTLKTKGLFYHIHGPTLGLAAAPFIYLAQNDALVF